MAERRYRVLALATHPVQYMTPIFRRMAKHPALEFQVAYCSLRGAEGGHDPEFGTDIRWDVPLLDGYEWVSVPNRGSGTASFFGFFNPGLWKFVRRGKFDAVLCFIGYVRASFWIAWLAANSTNAAFLFGTDAVSLDPLDGRMWKRSLKRVIWPILFRIVSQVLVSSSSTEELVLSLGTPAKRVTLTPSAVDNDWWADRASRIDRRAVRASWNVRPDDFVILFCAKLQPWKRPQDLLQAFARANIPNTVLVIAGEGPLRPQVESSAAALGVGDRVRFLGLVNQTQLPAVYKAADLMVLPSSHENFGFVVNEAMVCGCLVAVSDKVGAGRDLVAPVSPQLIFPCGDIAALAAILREVASDRARLESLARAARAHIESWSPERNIAATVDAVGLAVARRRPGPALPFPNSKASPTTGATTEKLPE